jgi:diaminohydroxyphosphoribosylaminopyrimidine deaminase / 5-amino-6-(5-phosphoribosylamino)uracil reductase
MTDPELLRLALDEATKGSPSPNPHVGAIVVASGEIVGRGHHPRAGREHAEVMALRQAGERARGATLYVTLEPCNHHGRTPPCTDAVLAAGIARVVVGVRDPDPRVQGGGNARLREAGVEVIEGIEEEACARMVRPFAKHARTGRPWIRLKLATSLDGRIAARGGVSKWITGEASRKRVHQTRAMVDAIAVGIGTALADDPSLTVRDATLPEGRDAPSRIVFDSNARLPYTSQLVTTAKQVPTIVVASREMEYPDGVRTLQVPHHDLDAALTALGASFVDILVEGGGTLAGALIKADLVDEIHWYLAPIFLGDDGVPAVCGVSFASPADARRYRVESSERLGDDTLITLLRPS